MKTAITNTIQTILSDRAFMISLIVLLAGGIIFAIYVALQIHPSELQVVTHYSSYGATKFYRDKWYYLIGFAVMGILTSVVYSLLACKMYQQKGRSLAIPFTWLGVIVIIFAAAVAYQVLKVASLS